MPPKARTRPSKPKLIAVVGPTASGKTDLAIAIAKKFGGEIISADSRQLYRGTEIGSDIIAGEWKKAEGENGRRQKGRRVYVAKGVAHHLIAFRTPDKPLTAGEYKRLAEKRIKEIAGRGNARILAGA